MQLPSDLKMLFSCEAAPWVRLIRASPCRPRCHEMAGSPQESGGPDATSLHVSKTTVSDTVPKGVSNNSLTIIPLHYI
jgi:hypothetical protein